MPKVDPFSWSRPKSLVKPITLRDPVRRPGEVITLSIKRLEGPDDFQVNRLYYRMIELYVTGGEDPETGQKFEAGFLPPIDGEIIPLTKDDAGMIHQACAFSCRQVVEDENDRYSPEQWIAFLHTAKLIWMGMADECAAIDKDDENPNPIPGGTGAGSPFSPENGTNDTPNSNTEKTHSSGPSTNGSDSSAAEVPEG